MAVRGLALVIPEHYSTFSNPVFSLSSNLMAECVTTSKRLL